MQIYLVEGNERVLSAMSPFASRRSKKYLEEFGVKVILGTRVQQFEDCVVSLSDGTAIPSNCLIWAAGVQGNFPAGFPEESVTRGRLHVDELHQVKGTHDVYAIGDVSYQELEGWPQGLPMLAPVAIQQARNLGRNLHRSLKKQDPRPMKYVDKGTMATIGRNRAVVDAPGWSFGGFFGWFVWMFIHLLSMMGFRRKLLVFSNWVWNYLSYNRGNRLIINIKERG